MKLNMLSYKRFKSQNEFILNGHPRSFGTPAVGQSISGQFVCVTLKLVASSQQIPGYPTTISQSVGCKLVVLEIDGGVTPIPDSINRIVGFLLKLFPSFLDYVKEKVLVRSIMSLKPAFSPS